jgi:hypothetical protein
MTNWTNFMSGFLGSVLGAVLGVLGSVLVFWLTQSESRRLEGLRLHNELSRAINDVADSSNTLADTYLLIEACLRKQRGTASDCWRNEYNAYTTASEIAWSKLKRTIEATQRSSKSHTLNAFLHPLTQISGKHSKEMSEYQRPATTPEIASRISKTFRETCDSLRTVDKRLDKAISGEVRR